METKTYEIRQVELPLNYSDNDVISAVSRKTKCQIKDIVKCNIVRRSLDARPFHPMPVYSATVEVTINGKKNFNNKSNDIQLITSKNTAYQYRQKKFTNPPVVVGAGVAGLMAAYYLAMAGACPILIERGCKAEERVKYVNDFWKNGNLNLNSNVLYGEGGAGLFSDGKLTARSKDRGRINEFFQILVNCGASEDILINAEPHLGSDVLLKLIPKIRNTIERLGGKIYHNTQLIDIEISNKSVSCAITPKERINTNTIILATGHSARDIYKMLSLKKAKLEAKPFAVGIRLEVPQSQINIARYRKFANNSLLEPANYKLTRLPESGVRACYTFCMCPGGVVIPCANEPGMLTTNGMSYSSRNLKYGNAAYIVPVEPQDYINYQGTYKAAELYGLNFQEKIEKAAFIAGGSDYSIPSLMLEDFLKGKTSLNLPPERSCMRSKPASFDNILPEFIINTLKHQIPNMLKQLNGVNIEDAILYAAETRSSSPVRVVRNESGESVNIKGLYPIGEGAGYAGGIVSSAVDGLKIAELVCSC